MFYLHSGNVPEPGNGPSFQADHFASIVDGSSSGSQNKGKAIRSSALLSTQSCGTRGKIFAAEGVHNPSVAAAAESGVQAHLLTTSSAASAAAARPGPSSSTQSRMGFLDVGRDKATARLADISPAAAAPADFVAAYQAVAAMQAPSLSEAEQRAAGQADGFMAWAIGTAVQDCSEVDGVPLIELLRATAKDNPGFLPFAARVGAAAVVTKLFTGQDGCSGLGCGEMGGGAIGAVGGDGLCQGLCYKGTGGACRHLVATTIQAMSGTTSVELYAHDGQRGWAAAAGATCRMYGTGNVSGKQLQGQQDCLLACLLASKVQ